MPLKENIPAPDFTLSDESGKMHTLSGYRGKFVLLYFYPKDDTPGCTTEACNFRDDYSAYEKAGVVILGVSPDNEKSHTKFKEKHSLPFTLLADNEKEVVQLYDVWAEKSIYGRTYFGVNRTSYLISPEGEIVKTYEKVKPASHSQEVLETVLTLS